MANYTKIVDYAAKDALNTGDPVKLVKGTELGAEYDAISVAIATKANTASPAFTGVSSFAVGAVGAPSIYMTGYATTGWYNIGANNWGFAVSGAKVLDIASTGLSVTGQVSATLSSGSGHMGTFTHSSTTGYAALGFTNNAGNNLSVGVGGATAAGWSQGLGAVGTTTNVDLVLGVNNSTVARLSSTGLAVTGTTSTTTGMAVGGATAGAGGIAFPATAVAVADVNTLDDYEEGTWTPGISFGGGTTGITYVSQQGSYTKIGNRVFCSCRVELSSKGSSTGQASITGLPFTVANSFNTYGGAGLRIEAITSTGTVQAYPEPNGTRILFEQISTAGNLTALADTNLSNTSVIMASIQYRI